MAFDLDDLRKEEGFQLVFPDKSPPVGGSDGAVFPDDYFLVAPSIDLHSVGDINGDGLADFATRVDLVGYDYPCEGPVIPLDFVVFGVPGRPADVLNLADIYRNGGGVIVEHSSGSLNASNASLPHGVGDVDGDGFDDWSVSFFAGQAYDPDLGSYVDNRYVSYVIPGEVAAPTYLTQFWASQLASSRVENAPSLYGVGDVNGDGLPDLGGAMGSGFALFGREGGPPRVTDAQVDYDLRFDAPPQGIGDFNGDGVDDVGFGAPYRYLEGDSGSGVFGLGDVNADGFADVGYIVASEPYLHPEENEYGADLSAVIAFGSSERPGGILEPDDIDDSNAVIIDLDFYVPRYDDSIRGFSKIGDVNGDGIDDVFLNGLVDETSFVDAVILFGGADAFDAPVDLSTLDPARGRVIDGGSYNSYYGAALGDVDGDGVNDLGVGRIFEADWSQSCGVIWAHNPVVLYGGPDIALRPDDGASKLTVIAGGTGGPVASPAFRVLADGVLVGEGAIADPQTNGERKADGVAYDSFVFDLSGLDAPPATIDIVYYNDGRDPVSREDLNLFIDAIVLGDRIYESETDGFFTPDRSVAGRDGPREALWWNGVLSFELDDALVA